MALHCTSGHRWRTGGLGALCSLAPESLFLLKWTKLHRAHSLQFCLIARHFLGPCQWWGKMDWCECSPFTTLEENPVTAGFILQTSHSQKAVFHAGQGWGGSIGMLSGRAAEGNHGGYCGLKCPEEGAELEERVLGLGTEWEESDRRNRIFLHLAYQPFTSFAGQHGRGPSFLVHLLTWTFEM